MKNLEMEVKLAILASICASFMIYASIYYEVYGAIKWIAIVLVSMIIALYDAIKSFKLYLKEQDEIRKICSSIDIEI